MSIESDAQVLGFTVILVCPACESWQVDCADEVMGQFASDKAWRAFLDRLTTEHYGHECPAPRLLYAQARAAGLL